MIPAFVLAQAFALAGAPETGRFAGAKVCASCHPDQAESQGATHHARALAKAPDGRWAFGAGAQAITYVSQAGEDAYLEHGLSWYRRKDGLDLTPGHREQRGVSYRTFAADSAILRCFNCHSTGALSLKTGWSLDPGEPGVRCESCHGPGAVHAARPSRENIDNPKRRTAAQINDLCGACHRMPPAQGAATNFDNPWNARHQPVYFSQSACFLKSGGKLACLSCHDTHRDTKPLGDAKCAECHPQPRHATPVAGQTCVECHMPAVYPSALLRFANHWIGIYRLAGPSANPLRPLPQRTSR